MVTRTAEQVLKAMYADQAVLIAVLTAELEALKAQTARPLPFSTTQTQTGS